MSTLTAHAASCVMDRQQAIRAMNELGSQGTPFLFIIDFLQEVPLVLPIEQAASRGVWFQFQTAANVVAVPQSRQAINLKTFPRSFDEYRRAFDRVQRELRAGNTYLLNLTASTRIELNLSLREIFHISKAKYKLLWEDRFVLFSPETFVQIRDGMIRTFPMKGTIDASLPHAQERLLNDPKETAEHATVVDLLRNDLSIVAKRVRVEEYRSVQCLRTHRGELLQVTSAITGELSKDFRNALGDIIFAILPAGSISGAPKKKTVEIIREAENDSRGYYTGVCGCFDGTTVDSGVMIRFIETVNDALYYRSGGGITAMSDPRQEYQELLDKIYVPVV